MNEDQQKMLDFLEDLTGGVMRGEVIGLAVGVVLRPKMVRALFFGQCAEHPLETIGVVHMMSRSIDEHLFAVASEPASPLRGSRKK
jgi:hypothetical protein